MVSSVLALLIATVAVTINGQGMGMSQLMSGGMNPLMGGGMNPLMGGGINPLMGGGMNPLMAAGATAGGSMPSPLPAGQTQQLWQQFMIYRLMFGDAAARLIMADRMANMMGGGMFTRYFAGEYFDTPDSWWITSSLMNRNNMQNTGAPTNALPGTSGTTNPIGAGSI